MYEYDFIDVPWQGYITGIMFCRSDGFFWSQIFLQCSWYALVQLQALSDSSSGWSQAFFFYPVDIYGSDRNSESVLRGQVLWPQDWVRPLEWIIWACFTVFLSSAYYTIQVKFVFDMTCLPHTTASSKSALLTIVNTPLIAAAETCCGFPVTWWFLTLCDPKDCSTRGLPVPHHHPKFAWVHVHCISDAVQPSHPLTPSSPFVLNLSQHQGFFQWVGCSHQMTKILELHLQLQSFQVFRVDLPWDWMVWSPCCLWDFQESSPVPQFKGINSLVLCLLYGPALTTVRDHWEDHSLDYTDFCWQSNVSTFQHTV